MVEQKKRGVNRCPKCGASEIEYDIKKEKLVCVYCHTEFESEKQDEVDLNKLEGVSIGDGSKTITNDDDLITLKCENCGAEVTINTKENSNYRCHWCHSILSLNSQVGNGAVPDLVLPFKLDKETAKNKINHFVSSKKFFADKKFKKEFKTDNIVGVYFPYLLIDCNAHANFFGEAGHIVRSYTKVVGKDKDGNEKKETFYDIDLYDIVRDFDITVDDLEIESSRDKINKYNNEKTTNVINSIMPFDTENCVKYESNYLVGFNSEKRDLNIVDLEEKIDKSLKDIIRHSIKNDLKFYNSGVSWKRETVDFKGKQILSAFLPVWLYSYQDKKKIIHYVAVNARTGETMGSVPVNKFRLVFLSIFLFFFVMLIPSLLAIGFSANEGEFVISFPALFFGLFMGIVSSCLLYFLTLDNYRNKGARHSYERETKTSMSNLERQDTKRKTLYERSSSFIGGINSSRLEGERITTK